MHTQRQSRISKQSITVQSHLLGEPVAFRSPGECTLLSMPLVSHPFHKDAQCHTYSSQRSWHLHLIHLDTG